MISSLIKIREKHMIDMVWMDSRVVQVVVEVEWMTLLVKCLVVVEAEVVDKSKNRELSHKQNKLK
jgi:hypothetical protein